MADERPTAEPPDGRGWLRRVLGRFVAQPRRGDVIAANVAGGAQGVAVGKNIVQIGTLQVPVWPLFALLLVLTAGAGVWALAQRGPATMQGQFNVAVARFGKLDTAGRLTSSGEGDEVGRQLYEVLAPRIRDYARDNATTASVWRDGSSSWREQGAEVGLVSTAQVASEVSKRLQAHVLIFGQIDERNHMQLQFYLAPQVRPGGDLRRLAGSYAFADIANWQEGDELTVRASALFYIVAGLDAFSQGKTSRALGLFNQAQALLRDEHAEGKEALYFLIGTCAQYLAIDPESALNADSFSKQAENAFRQALAINRTYLRAQVGLADVYFERAQRQPDADRLTTLEHALEGYQQAVAALPTAADTTWAAAAAPLGLANAAYLKGATLFARRDDAAAEPLLTQASVAIRQLIPTLESTQDPRLLAQAYLTLGNAQLTRGWLARERQQFVLSRELFTGALAAYDACEAQGKSAPADHLLRYQIIKDCLDNRASAAGELARLAGAGQ